MDRRIRTSKKLAQRIDRTYLTRLFPIPRWRRILTLAAVCAGLAWLGFRAIARDQTPYTSGLLTPAHAILGGHCASCHVQGTAMGRKPTDKACLSCHDASVHNEAQTFTPACVECHVEHGGEGQLLAANNQTCTRCHANLRTRSGKLQVAAEIGSFADQHPEFAALRNGADPAAIKFNHEKHVHGDIPLKCGECHHPGNTQTAWNFGQAPPVPPPAVSAAAPSGRLSPGALMQPINYYEQCSTCHQLTFDDRISDPAPHDEPAVVHAFVTRKLRDYIAGHKTELGKAGAPASPDAWVAFRVSQDEQQLWATTCQKCHNMQPAAAGSLPGVPETKINRRWFTKAEFDHSAHGELQCESCHANAASSTKASDILLPGIQVCRQCHGAAAVPSASTECSTCHLYHDPAKARPVDGPFSIHQLTTRIFISDFLQRPGARTGRVT